MDIIDGAHGNFPGGCEQRIAELEGENERLRAYTTATVCCEHVGLPAITPCSHGNPYCGEARFALAPEVK